MEPLIYQFYIRDLHKFESSVIVLLERFGYRVEMLDYESMILVKGNLFQCVFSKATLSQRSRIFIDYSDNLVKIKLERRPSCFRRNKSLKDIEEWSSFFSYMIQIVQLECLSPIFTEKVQKKSEIQYL